MRGAPRLAPQTRADPQQYRQRLASFACEVSLLQGFLFRGFLCRPLLLCARTRESVGQPVIPFVTGVLEYRTTILLPRHFSGPGSRPCRWILDRELISKGVFGDTGEALGQTHVLARAQEREL